MAEMCPVQKSGIQKSTFLGIFASLLVVSGAIALNVIQDRDRVSPEKIANLMITSSNSSGGTIPELSTVGE